MAVATLGSVYVGSNVTLAAQVRWASGGSCLLRALFGWLKAMTHAVGVLLFTAVCDDNAGWRAGQPGTAPTPCQAHNCCSLHRQHISICHSCLLQVSLSLAIAESLAARLRSELFRRLLGRDAVFFDSVKTGQMVSWLGQDVEVLQVRGIEQCILTSSCSACRHECFGHAALLAAALVCGLHRGRSAALACTWYLSMQLPP